MILTDWMIILIAVIAIVFDIYIVIKKGVPETISYRLYTWSHKYPVISFAIGFLMGHLFWGQKD